MHSEHIKVLVGGECEAAELAAKYLENGGLSVKKVEINPLSIQFEAMKCHYDAVIIYHRTKFPRSLCENLKRIEMPPSLILLRDKCDELSGFSGLEKYFDALVTVPDDNEYLYRRIVETARLSERKTPSASTSAEIIPTASVNAAVKPETVLHNLITGILNKLCVSPRYTGYNYIREAVKLAALGEGAVKGVSKQIYPDVASKLGVTASGVERNIRTAIHKAWEKADPFVKVEMFGTYALTEDWVPTNSEFIYIIAEKINCEMKKALI